MDFYNIPNLEQLTEEFTHEVKNPVALIQANIDYIQTSDKSGVYEKNYGVMKKELQKIINVVKDFAKVVSSVNNAEREVIFIYDLIVDMIDEFSTPFDGKKISFDFTCDDEDLKIFGEYSKICMVFFNVIKNAIEAIKDEGKISIAVKRESEEIIIKISDDGLGIDKSFSEIVCNPFFTTKANGSGLGLPICKKIIESHKGKFYIYNNEIEGCTVEIRLLSFSDSN